MTDSNETPINPSFTSRQHFEQLGFTDAPDDTLNGTADGDELTGDPAPALPAGLAGALAFWSFDNGSGGSFADARGGPAAAA